MSCPRMVDWDRVERLRSKGVDWESIADDEKVNFTPPAGVDDAGKALKTLYYSRKSGKPRSGGKKSSQEKAKGPFSLKSRLLPWGLTITILSAIWFPLAYEFSLVGFLVPAIPYVLLILVLGVIFIAASFVLGTAHIRENWKKPVTIGIVIGLILPGMFALISVGLNVPILYQANLSEPGGWESESPRNAVWEIGGLPTYFFLGSIACPFCSASSWAMYEALSNVGTLSGVKYGYSNPNDTAGPNTPEVELYAASLSSSYLSLDVKEGADRYMITTPSLTTQEQAYVSFYDVGGGIPFVVVGGMFIHTNSFVQPDILAGMTTTQVMDILENPSSNPTVYNDIHGQQLYIEAYFVKSDQIAGVTPPTFGSDETAVMNYVGQIK